MLTKIILDVQIATKVFRKSKQSLLISYLFVLTRNFKGGDFDMKLFSIQKRFTGNFLTKSPSRPLASLL